MITPFGSILSNVEDIQITTTDNISRKLDRCLLLTIGLKLLGIPHLGLRIRAFFISRYISSYQTGLVLDAGGGIGIYSFTLSNVHRKFILMDKDFNKMITAKKIKQQLKSKNVFIVNGDIEHLPFKQNIFDTVLSSEVLEHIEDDRGALLDMNRVISTGGVLMLSTTHAGSEINISHKESFQHFREGYTEEDLQFIMKGSHFHIKNIKKYGGKIGQMLWKCNRFLFDYPVLLSITFYLFYFVAVIETLLKEPESPIGYVVVAVKEHSSEFVKTENVRLEERKYVSANFLKNLLISMLMGDVSWLLNRIYTENILDVGCGTGYFSKKSAPYHRKPITGVDMDFYSLIRAQEKKIYRHLVCASCKRLPFKDGAFNCVMAVEMLEHITKPENSLEEISRVSGRYILLSVPDEPFFSLASLLSGKYIIRLGRHPDHKNFWSKRGFVDFISKWVEPSILRTPFPWIVILGKKLSR